MDGVSMSQYIYKLNLFVRQHTSEAAAVMLVMNAWTLPTSTMVNTPVGGNLTARYCTLARPHLDDPLR